MPLYTLTRQVAAILWAIRALRYTSIPSHLRYMSFSSTLVTRTMHVVLWKLEFDDRRSPSSRMLLILSFKFRDSGMLCCSAQQVHQVVRKDLGRPDPSVHVKHSAIPVLCINWGKRLLSKPASGLKASDRLMLWLSQNIMCWRIVIFVLSEKNLNFQGYSSYVRHMHTCVHMCCVLTVSAKSNLNISGWPSSIWYRGRIGLVNCGKQSAAVSEFMSLQILQQQMLASDTLWVALCTGTISAVVINPKLLFTTALWDNAKYNSYVKQYTGGRKSCVLTIICPVVTTKKNLAGYFLVYQSTLV